MKVGPFFVTAMLILISAPDIVPNEAALVNEMLGRNSRVLFHLRKPGWNTGQTAELLNAIREEFLSRVVLHQHFGLAEKFGVKCIHLNENNRKTGLKPAIRVVSTSFHSLRDARSEGGSFSYFFCSPVFTSISKPGYKPSESWIIGNESEEFQQKAVALGGVSPSSCGKLREKGFRNAAVLGYVWNANDPGAAFDEIVRAFDAGFANFALKFSE